MKKIFFDTSILSRVAWSRESGSMEKPWDSFLEQMDVIYPDFSEEAFVLITSAAWYLEVIGFGGIRDSNKIKNSIFEKKPFKPLRRLRGEDGWKLVSSLEQFFSYAEDCVYTFIKNELNPRNLYRQTLKFWRGYPSHRLSHFIVANIKRWGKDMKAKSYDYEWFLMNFFWDSLFRYVGICNLNTIAKEDREEAEQFWAAVLGIAYREYHYEYTNNVPLEVGALGLFAAIDRVGSSINGITNQRGFNEVLRPWDDMVDADSIQYALVGKRINLEKNDPVIVVTGDKREDIERRLECLHKNLQIMADKGLPINRCPGSIITFSLETMKINSLPLDVLDFINKLDSIKGSSLAQD